MFSAWLGWILYTAYLTVLRRVGAWNMMLFEGFFQIYQQVSVP